MQQIGSTTPRDLNIMGLEGRGSFFDSSCAASTGGLLSVELLVWQA